MSRRSSTFIPVFDARELYQYPEHLRCWLTDMPKVPGVYLFHGESESWPLYIGKSVNIRSRVMSHLRNPDEASMLMQTQRISWLPTAGELGALLLEAQLIKTHQPLFNKRLRRNRQLCSIRWEQGRPEIVSASQVDFAQSQHLYGLFASRRAAVERLRYVADEQRLCYGLLGLESLSAGRPCFRVGLKRCAGACCGMESIDDHDGRLAEALSAIRVVCWPWPGAIAVAEQGPDLCQYHVIDNWFYLGSVNSLGEAQSLRKGRPGFDLDGYKILCRLLLAGDRPIVTL